MTHSNQLKKKVEKLRKQGVSINSIARQTNLAKSTVSVWARNIPLSKKIKAKLNKNSFKGLQKAQKILKKRKEIEKRQCYTDAKKTISSLNFSNEEQCKIIASIIYWCEGEKNNPSSARLANSDPELIKTYLYCLRKGFNIKEERLHALIHLHDYHNEEKQTKFWSKITKIPKEQFNKSYRKPHTSKRKRKNYQGCISIRCGEAIVAKKLTAIYHTLANNIGP